MGIRTLRSAPPGATVRIRRDPILPHPGLLDAIGTDPRCELLTESRIRGVCSAMEYGARPFNALFLRLSLLSRICPGGASARSNDPA